MKGHTLNRFELGVTHGWVTAAIAAGSALLSQRSSRRESRRGSRASERLGRERLEEDRRQYDQAREDQAPWRQAGEAALVGLAEGTADLADYQFDFDSSQVGESDAYKWRVEQGTRAADRALIAAGKGVSGERIHKLTDLGQRMASQEYEAEWGRQHKTALTNYGFRQDHLNRLAGIAGVGQTANSTLASLAGSLSASGAQTTGNVMDAIQGGADRRAAGIEGMVSTGVNFLNDMASSGDWFSDEENIG